MSALTRVPMVQNAISAVPQAMSTVPQAMSAVPHAIATATGSTPPRPATTPLGKIERQYREALGRRWITFILRANLIPSVGFALVVAVISRNWKMIPVAYLIGVVSFLGGVYPVLMVRRNLLIAPPPKAIKTGLLSLISNAFTSSTTIRLSAAYLLSSVVISFVYTQAVTLGWPERDLGLFASTPRHPWHFNERTAFLFLGLAHFLVGHAVSIAFGGPIHAIWATRRMPLFIAVRHALYESLPSVDDTIFGPLAGNFNTMSGAVIWAGLYTVVYKIMGRWIWSNVLVYTWGIFRPVMVNFTKTSRSGVSWGLGWQLILLELLALGMIKAPEAVVNAYVTQPLSFEPFIRKSPYTPDRYLLIALKSENPYYLHFTLMELLRAVQLPERRRVIFADITKSPSQGQALTADFFQELLFQLGRINMTLVTRGGSRSFGSAAAPNASTQLDAHTLQLKSGDIFRPVSKQRSAFGQVIQNVLDGPVTPQPPPPTVAKINAEARMITDKAMEKASAVQGKFLRQIEASPIGQSVMVKTQGWFDGAHRWAGREWARRNVDRAMPRLEDVRLIINVIATLVVASVEEDTYGHVQHLLPSTLEAIIRLRSAIINLESELLYQAQALGKGQPIASEEVKSTLGPAITACENGVLRIAERFGKSLGALKFPPSIGGTLNEICRELQ